MAYKHIFEYYKEIQSQYNSLLEELKDFTAEAEQGLIDPSVLESVKVTLEPLKQNYERWTYMMYLLHLPVKKSKQHRYCKQNPTLEGLNPKNSLENVLKENTTALERVQKR